MSNYSEPTKLLTAFAYNVKLKNKQNNFGNQRLTGIMPLLGSQPIGQATELSFTESLSMSSISRIPKSLSFSKSRMVYKAKSSPKLLHYVAKTNKPRKKRSITPLSFIRMTL